MGEIIVGDYVRTKKGIIAKVISVEIEKYDDGTAETFIETELNPGYLDYTNKDIVKHSPNIIDLVEKRRLCEWRKGTVNIRHYR